jgi:hypothetical protein
MVSSRKTELLQRGRDPTFSNTCWCSTGLFQLKAATTTFQEVKDNRVAAQDAERCMMLLVVVYNEAAAALIF